MPADFTPVIATYPLAAKVLAVAQTRIEGTWAAYIDAVPGLDHRYEIHRVLADGQKLQEEVARILFPRFAEVPYAH